MKYYIGSELDTYNKKCWRAYRDKDLKSYIPDSTSRISADDCERKLIKIIGEETQKLVRTVEI